MYTSVTALLAAGAAVASAASVPIAPRDAASITPHAQYSSSVGVLGCMIDTNRVAYWPGSVSCDKICVKVSYKGRSVNLLKIDSSAGAHDISYDAWNYLAFGKSATSDPQMGGGIAMNYEFVDNSQCAHLLPKGKLPLSAANSMNFVASCLAEPNSWVAKNHELVNILDPTCHWGYEETCSLNLAKSNQPSCPHTLGSMHKLNKPVYNIEYGTGKKVVA